MVTGPRPRTTRRLKVMDFGLALLNAKARTSRFDKLRGAGARRAPRSARRCTSPRTASAATPPTTAWTSTASASFCFETLVGVPPFNYTSTSTILNAPHEGAAAEVRRGPTRPPGSPPTVRGGWCSGAWKNTPTSAPANRPAEDRSRVRAARSATRSPTKCSPRTKPAPAPAATRARRSGATAQAACTAWVHTLDAWDARADRGWWKLRGVSWKTRAAKCADSRAGGSPPCGWAARPPPPAAADPHPIADGLGRPQSPAPAAPPPADADRPAALHGPRPTTARQPPATHRRLPAARRPIPWPTPAPGAPAATPCSTTLRGYLMAK